MIFWGILILGIIFVVSTYNELVRINNTVKEAFATMDVYLKKRWDLVPNLVNVVKGYAKHEKNTLEEVIKLRNTTYPNMSNNEKIEVNEQLSRGINKIIALCESYPDLKANENFKELSSQLSSIEDDIANSRRYYNGAVRLFNSKLEIFPNNILVKLWKFPPAAMFEISSDERNNVNIDF
ncbi:MAG: LemA family protein [Clostridiales bacterium]|nr:LemA family protein [Clostridiales bacterium]